MNPLIAAEQAYDQDEQAATLTKQLLQLNTGQQSAFDTIVQAVDTNPEQAHFFVQGPAGTGKTFLWTALCHQYHSQGKVVLCIASSGIASLLLPGGLTAHSWFNIPLNCTSTSTCQIFTQSSLAALLQTVSLIIWDKVLMQHKFNLTAVNITLCDIQQNESLFGGIPVVFGGDFTQTLPVVSHDVWADQVVACMQ